MQTKHKLSKIQMSFSLVVICVLLLSAFSPAQLQSAIGKTLTAPIAFPMINEFSVSTVGTDVEYLEIYGTPNTDYSAYKLLEIEGDYAATGTGVGYVDGVENLGTTDANGFLLINVPANTYENNTLTLLLVQGWSGAAGVDLDTNNDGIFESTPWTALVDSIAVNDNSNVLDKTYAGAPELYPLYDGLPYAPGGASRIPNGTDTDTINDWVRNDFDLAGIPGYTGTPIYGEALNTPGTINKRVAPVINEFVVNHTGADTNEYIEIVGEANKDFSFYYILQVDGDASNQGIIDRVDQVGTTDANGFWTTGLLTDAYENGTLTFLMVSDFSGSVGADLDTDDDGVFDSTPWTEIVDDVAVSDGGVGDVVYSTAVLTSNYDGLSTQVPGGASRIPNGKDTGATSDWLRNDFDGAGLPGYPGTPIVGEAINTPAALNRAVGVTISKSALAVVEPGDLFTYTLTLENYSGVALSGVLIKDIVPDDTTLAYVLDGDWNAVVGDEIQWYFGYIPYESSVDVRFAVTATTDNDVWVINDDYSATAFNYADPIVGNPLTTLVYTGHLRIHHIQGLYSASPFLGQTLSNIYGIVTNVKDDGFFMQDPNPDTYAQTSEGVFVYTSTPPVLNVGDALTVTATVDEYYTMTELKSATWASAAPGTILPTAVDLPVVDSLEPYEGMLVTFTDVMRVAQNYFLGRYGQLTLSAEGPMYNPWSDNDTATLEENLRRMIVLDDNSKVENPDPIPYIAGDLTVRAGDTTTGLTGVIDYEQINSGSGRFYRLHPTQPVTFTRVNERTTAPDLGASSLRVASFNVYNYFNGNGDGTGFPTSRGADSLDEFTRQRTKIITALLSIDADVIGLMEIEQDNAYYDTQVTAIEDLVSGLNDIAGTGTYTYTVEPAPGDDEIKVSLIYKPAKVTPVGPAQNYQTDLLGYTDVFDRPPLGQTFSWNGTGDIFTVIVNHFKSKNCGGETGGDVDLGDGKGCYNAKRTAQATALLDFIDQMETSSGNDNLIVLGDLNAYAEEDPIDVLVNAGLVNMVSQYMSAADRYSYVFDGQLGYLDHMLVSASMAWKSIGATIWHINCDEPTFLDYDEDYNPPAFYAPTPYRSSDHDPVIAAFNMFWIYLPIINQ